MCRSTAAPLLAIVGVAGTAAGVGLAVIRDRLDRLADSRAAKEANDAKRESEPRESVSTDSNNKDND